MNPFLKDIYQEHARATNSPLDRIKKDLNIRFSIDIERGFSFFLHKCRVAKARTGMSKETIGRFLQENML